MTKLKIGLVFDDSLDKPDGVQQYILALGDWLRSQGHEVHYLVGATKRRDLPHIHVLSRNVAVRYNGNQLSIPLPASRRRIRRLLKNEQFDVLHVQTPYSPFLAQQIINLASPSTAVIGTFHILPNSRTVALANRLLAIWNGRSLRRFDTMLSVSAAAQTFASRVYGLPSTVLPNVVDYHRFSTALPLAKPPKVQRIIFLGRLVPRKGCLTLLQALILLRQTSELPPYEVVICGKGPLAAQLQAFVKTNQLDNTVSFTGFVSEAAKPNYLRSADIAVFPSSGGESFGIVLIEALAAGAVVLAGDNPGYRSVLALQPDLLFDAKNPADLATKLQALLIDRPHRHKLRAWGQAYARQFDTATVGQALLSIYKQALRNRRNLR